MTVCHTIDQVGIKLFHIIILVVLKLLRSVQVKDHRAQTHTASQSVAR